MRIPSITDILKAAKTLRGKVRRTPLEYSHPLSKLTGGDVFLKLENQQHTNSFKIRGAPDFLDLRGLLLFSGFLFLLLLFISVLSIV